MILFELFTGVPFFASEEAALRSLTSDQWNPFGSSIEQQLLDKCSDKRARKLIVSLLQVLSISIECCFCLL